MKLAALGLGLAIGWVCAEIVVAFAVPGGEEDLVFLQKDGSIQWDCYCSNPRGYFVEREGPDGRTIYCVDHSDDPPRVVDLGSAEHSDAYKIVTVGDSFTWGLGVKVVDGYPYLLAVDLQKRVQRPVVVSNHAQVGRWIMEIQEEMKQAVSVGAPDLCIYGYVLNDPLDNTQDRTSPVAPSEKASGMDNAHIDDFINVRTANLKKFRLESPLQPLRKSGVIDLALRQWEWRRIHQRTLQFYRDLYDPAKNSRGLALTWNALQSMNQLQTSRGKRFLVVLFPLFINVDSNYPFTDVHQLLSARLSQMGIPHLDLLPIYAEHPNDSLCVHPLDRHPNEVAHRLAAKAIADFIVKEGWANQESGNQFETR